MCAASVKVVNYEIYHEPQPVMNHSMSEELLLPDADKGGATAQRTLALPVRAAFSGSLSALPNAVQHNVRSWRALRPYLACNLCFFFHVLFFFAFLFSAL